MSLLPPLFGTVLSFKGGINVSVRCKHTTAREGNVFRGMCHSVHRGVSIQSPEAKSLSGGGAVSCVLTSSGGHCCGRYASYWNAFFIRSVFVCLSTRWRSQRGFWSHVKWFWKWWREVNTFLTSVASGLLTITQILYFSW